MAPARVDLLKAIDATKDQSYFLHRLTQAQLAPALFPLGEIAEARGARDRAARGHSDLGEEGFDRHLLHRRAPVPRFSRALPAARARADRDARRRARSDATTASRTTRSGQRQGLGIGGLRDGARRAVVRRRQGHGAQRADRRAGTRSPAALSARRRCVGHALDCRESRRRCPARYAAKTRYRMPDATCSLRVDRRREAKACARARELRRAAMGTDAGPVPRAVRRRCVPRRWRDRGARSATSAADTAAGTERRARSMFRIRRPCGTWNGGGAVGGWGRRLRARHADGTRTGCRRRSRRRSSSPPPAGLAPPPPTAPTAALAPLAPPPPPPANSTSPPPPPSRAPPISCMRSATISVEYFSTPSLSVYLRVCSRPSI